MSHHHRMRRRAIVLAILLCLEASLPQLHSPVRAQGALAAYAYWTMPLPEPPLTVLSGDTDGDGQGEIVVVGQLGYVALLEADGTVVWESEGDEELGSACLADLNGDGRLELLIGGPRGVSALDGAGRSLWFYRTAYAVQAVTAQDVTGDGRAEVFAATQYEHVYCLSHDGQVVWHYWSPRRGFGGTVTGLAVGDFDGDARDEVALGFDFPGYKEIVPSGHVLLLDDDGTELWKRNEASGVLGVAVVDPDGWGKPMIAAGMQDGLFIVLFGDAAVRWQYDLGAPVKHVLGGDIDDDGRDEVIAVATDHYLALDDDGSPLWERSYTHQALAAALGDLEGNAGRPLALLSLEPGLRRTAIEVINVRGGIEESYALPEVPSRLHLADLNRDGWAELLVASDEALQSLARARGAAHSRVAWQYRVRGSVTVLHAVDLDGDGRSEVLAGSDDRGLYVLKEDGSLAWRHAVAGAVRCVTSGDANGDGQREVIVAYNELVERGEAQRSGLTVLRGDGRVLWTYEHDLYIWVLSAADLDGDGRDEVLMGAGNDRVLALCDGQVLWSHRTSGSVLSLRGVDLDGDGRAEVLVGSEDNRVYLLSGDGSLRWDEDFRSDVRTVCAADLDGDGPAEVIAAVEAGVVYALRLDGSILWQYDLQDVPFALHALDSDGDGRVDVVTATTDGGLYVLTANGVLLWRYAIRTKLLSMFPGDVDGDDVREVVTGSADGVLYLVGYGGTLLARHEVGQTVAALYVGDIDGDSRDEILVGTRDGQLDMYEHTPNRPPLLANPSVARSEPGYVYTVAVNDPEDDRVEVTLRVQDPFSGAWQVAETKYTLTAGTLYWFVNPFLLLASGRTAAYAFTYSDGLNSGTVGGVLGPRVPGFPWYVYATVLGLVGLVVAAYRLWRGSPARHARLLYARLVSNPQDLPAAMRDLAASRASSTETLIRLAQRARTVGDKALASLAEGYLLLSSRPAAGLQVVAAALGQIAATRGTQESGRRALTELIPLYELLADLLEANSIGRILVLRPRLQRVLRQWTVLASAPSSVEGKAAARLQHSKATEGDGSAPLAPAGMGRGVGGEGLSALPEVRSALTQLTQVMRLLHNCERTGVVDDKLDCLAQAGELLAALEKVQGGPEAQVIAQIAANWQRVIATLREEWQGRAQLLCRLRTRRIVATGEAVLLLDVQNKGRSPALRTTVELTANGGYTALDAPLALGTIGPGQVRQAELRLQPPPEERFRVEFLLRYDDQEARGQSQLFADMVEVLAPAEFQVIPNPYVPGRPLGPASRMFYGREDVFDFVADNARGLLQRNILILIGQRRTGKTSILLQLPLRLDEHYLPVYLDCQSLGLTPGLSAWLHDVASTIADALAQRGVEVPAPELATLREQPARVFEHRFLRQVQEAIGERTLLLVLDEFEELESRVRAGRLDPTLFPYLRHLMQHTEKVGFVFVGTHRLEEMSTDYWSVLFNIALYRHIGYLDEEAAQRLISEPVRPYGMVYDDLALHRMWQVTAGHPYFLQILCYSLVNAHNQSGRSYTTVADVDAALEEILTLGSAHFSFLWETSSDHERAALLALTRLLPRLGQASWPHLGATPSDVTLLLAENGLTLDPQAVSAALRRLAAREILREVPGDVERYVFRVGLVALWVEHYKSLPRVIEELEMRNEK